jgi:hypothetical protein
LQTGHHLLPGRCLRNSPGYNHDAAPVICVSRGNQHQGSHKRCHEKFDPVELAHERSNTPFRYDIAREAAVNSAGGALEPPKEPDQMTDKEKACLRHQLDHYYKNDPKGPKLNDGSPLRTSEAPGKVIPPASPAGPSP